MAVDTYLDNVTSQYRDKSNFIAWLSTHLTIVDGIYNILKSLDDNFDLDYAIGAQLDTLGVIIGRSRTLNFNPSDGSSATMDDDTYRTVLKAKIAMNNWDGTVPSMYEIWDDLFSNDDDMTLKLKDNQDMSFDALITGYVTQLQQELIMNGYVVPKPEGVRVNYATNSEVPFNVYSYMSVAVYKNETINMIFDPVEYIQLNSYSRMTVQEIKTETITLKGGK
jgi:hypothetical protein